MRLTNLCHSSASLALHMTSYLHCTSSCDPALIALPSPLSAQHQYSPVLFLDAFKFRVLPLPTVFSSFIHFISGTGLPMAVQCNAVSSNSVTVLSIGFFVKLGGTAIEKEEYHGLL